MGVGRNRSQPQYQIFRFSIKLECLGMLSTNKIELHKKDFDKNGTFPKNSLFEQAHYVNLYLKGTSSVAYGSAVGVMAFLSKFYSNLSPRRAALFGSLGHKPVDTALTYNTASAGWRHKITLPSLYACSAALRGLENLHHNSHGLKPEATKSRPLRGLL